MYNPTKPYKAKVLECIRKTWNASPYIRVFPGGGFHHNGDGYALVYDHTDGIGTKGYYHWRKKSWAAAVQDALAMNLNDLLMVRAVPYKLQNHIVLPEDDERAVLKIVEDMADQCLCRKIVITGGETAVHTNTDGMDISITISGLVKTTGDNKFLAGDQLLGLPSSGLHSNGFTRVRELYDHHRDEFVKPTTIYWDDVYPVLPHINGVAHITGGAFTKVKDHLAGVDVYIGGNERLTPQPIFGEIYNKIKDDEEMYRTFNCGIGLILAVAPEKVGKVKERLPKAATIGSVIGDGTGRVTVRSSFSDRTVTF